MPRAGAVHLIMICRSDGELGGVTVSFGSPQLVKHWANHYAAAPARTAASPIRIF